MGPWCPRREAWGTSRAQGGVGGKLVTVCVKTTGVLWSE